MSDRSRRLWLILAAACGCLVAGMQVLHDLRIPLQFLPGVAARVNAREIDLDSVNRTVAGMALRDSSALPAARERVLSRMIDEELLIQHALDSGAAMSDPAARAALVRAAVARVSAEVAAQPISERDLTDYYRDHQSAYATPARFWVTPLYFGSASFPDLADARRRVTEAQSALRASRPLASLQDAADALPFVAPAESVSARTLGNYFGPSIAQMLEAARAGDLAGPAAFGQGLVLLYVNRKIAGEQPDLASVRELVRSDALRERQEAALDGLLQSLRKAARIEIARMPSTALASQSATSAQRAASR